ncbi:MAG: DUF2267 domain-containing protein [Synechococcus sp.]
MTAAQISPSPNPNVEFGTSLYQKFLETVAVQGGLDSTYDARDIAEVVFRSIRDLMPTEASDRIASELDGKSDSLAQLWKDTNLIVRWLSRVRPPLEVKDEVFLTRIQQEAGVPLYVDSADVMVAVFRGIKEVLSLETNSEIARHLPGQIRVAWNRA